MKTAKPVKQRLLTESLVVESFEPANPEGAREFMMTFRPCDTNHGPTGIDSTCQCCSDPFTCPCSYPNCRG